MSDTLTYVWELEGGQDAELTVPITEGGDPVDLTGRTVDVKVRTQPGGSVLYQLPASAAELIHVDHSDAATPDGVRLSIPGAVSRAWFPAWSTGWWRMVITEPEGSDPERVVQGPFIVNPD